MTTDTVPLFDENGMAIGRVNCQYNCDIWDGHNWQNGGAGNHRGVGKTTTGKFYIIHGSDWEGVQSTANIVSKEEAESLAIASGMEDDDFEEIFGEPIPRL